MNCINIYSNEFQPHLCEFYMQILSFIMFYQDQCNDILYTIVQAPCGYLFERNGENIFAHLKYNSRVLGAQSNVFFN